MINDKQKLALEILWCQRKTLIIANAHRYGIQPGILIGLVGAYATLTDKGFYSSTTYRYDKGWMSDEVTPDKARYGYTQIRLSTARSLQLDIEINRKVLSNSAKCFMITSRILSQVDYKQPLDMLSYWHGAETPESIQYKFRGCLSYFSRSVVIEEKSEEEILSDTYQMASLTTCVWMGVGVWTIVISS